MEVKAQYLPKERYLHDVSNRFRASQFHTGSRLSCPGHHHPDARWPIRRPLQPVVRRRAGTCPRFPAPLRLPILQGTRPGDRVAGKTEFANAGISVAYIGCGTAEEAQAFRSELDLTSPVYHRSRAPRLPGLRNRRSNCRLDVQSTGARRGNQGCRKGIPAEAIERKSASASGTVPDRPRWHNSFCYQTRADERHPLGRRPA